MTVSFFSPVVRVYGVAIPGQLEKKFANALDFIFSSPFATSATQVNIDLDHLYRHRLYRPGAPYQYTTYRINSQNSLPIPLWQQVLKVAAFALLIFRYPRVGVGICLVGFLFKALYRNWREEFLPAVPPPPRPQFAVPVASGSSSSPEMTVRKHLQKWYCEAAFYFYLMGGRELGVEENSSAESLKVLIGEEEQSYSLKFLMQIPYFEATLRWHPGDIIVLSEGFPFSHGDLERLQSVVERKDLSSWDESFAQHFGFLCIPLEDYRAFSRFHQLQELLQKPAHEISFEGSERFSELPPQVKCIQWSMNVVLDWDLSNLTVENGLDHLKKVIDSKILSEEKKHCLTNHIIDTYISELNSQGELRVLERLLSLLEGVPRATTYLTILRLPHTSYASLGALLKQLPNLCYLQTMIYQPEEIPLHSIPICGNIRIFSNDGYGASGLKEKFPHCDIFEET